MSWGNVIGPSIDQTGPLIAYETTIHLKFYHDRKLNPLLTHPPTERDESWEKEQKEMLKLQVRQHNPDRKRHEGSIPSASVLH